MQFSIEIIIKQQLGLSHDEAENDSEVLINAFDREHHIVFWNRKAENYFGIPKEQALGKKFEDIVGYAKKNDKMQYLTRALFGQPVHILREKYDKRSTHYEQWVLPVRKNGEVIAALNIVKDIK